MHPTRIRVARDAEIVSNGVLELSKLEYEALTKSKKGVWAERLRRREVAHKNIDGQILQLTEERDIVRDCADGYAPIYISEITGISEDRIMSILERYNMILEDCYYAASEG